MALEKLPALQQPSAREHLPKNHQNQEAKLFSSSDCPEPSTDKALGPASKEKCLKGPDQFSHKGKCLKGPDQFSQNNLKEWIWS